MISILPSPSVSSAGKFVRDFFLFLDQKGIKSAVLHGWGDGFDHVLTDVDFVVDRSAFERLPALIHEHASRSGWMLCQVLRHEVTAAFFVCSTADGSGARVALDGCSDYQRFGIQFLSCEYLLENRVKLDSGIHRLTEEAELRYRFSKASAKSKLPEAAAGEFGRYPHPAKSNCGRWLFQRWGIDLEEWTVDGVVSALDRLRGECRNRPRLMQPGSLSRIGSRVLEPTGMLIITGSSNFDAKVAEFQQQFGDLHFRRVLKTRRWRTGMIVDLISSALIMVPALGLPWRQILPKSCVHWLDDAEDIKGECRRFAKRLNERVVSRENL